MFKQNNKTQHISPIDFESILIKEESKDKMIHENFIFIFGCEPANGVKAQTDMVKNFINHCSEVTVNGKLIFPQALQNLEGADACFETITSSKIQPSVMIRQNDITTSKVALIFRKSKWWKYYKGKNAPK